MAHRPVLLAPPSHAETLLAYSKALLETQQCQEDCPCFQNGTVLLGKGKPNCYPCWLSWPQYSWANYNANTPHSSLQRCRDLYLPALASGFPSHRAQLAPNSGIQPPPPDTPITGSLGAAPWWWRVVPVLCTLPCSSLGQSQLVWSCTTVLTSSPLCSSSARRGSSPVRSEGGPALPGLCCSSLAPSTAKASSEGSALTSQLGWVVESDAGAYLWEGDTAQFLYSSQASWRILGARGVLLPSPHGYPAQNSHLPQEPLLQSREGVNLADILKHNHRSAWFTHL